MQSFKPQNHEIIKFRFKTTYELHLHILIFKIHSSEIMLDEILKQISLKHFKKHKGLISIESQK